ncbi:MAG TPA: hypothetical protein VGG78_05595, partial [Gemmatimonadaceae bacterium]
AQVFVDGNEVTNGMFVHENCADQGAPTFTTQLGPGNHVLAIHGRDRGGFSYLDASISKTVTPQ